MTPTPRGEGGREVGALGAANARRASSEEEIGPSAEDADVATTPRPAPVDSACTCDADGCGSCVAGGAAGGAGGRTRRPPALSLTSARDDRRVDVTFACAGAARRTRCPPAAARELEAAVCFAKRELTSAADRGVSLARVRSVRTSAAVASSSSAARASRDDGGWCRGDASVWAVWAARAARSAGAASGRETSPPPRTGAARDTTLPKSDCAPPRGPSDAAAASAATKEEMRRCDAARAVPECG